MKTFSFEDFDMRSPSTIPVSEVARQARTIFTLFAISCTGRPFKDILLMTCRMDKSQCLVDQLLYMLRFLDLMLFREAISSHFEYKHCLQSNHYAGSQSIPLPKPQRRLPSWLRIVTSPD